MGTVLKNWGFILLLVCCQPEFGRSEDAIRAREVFDWPPAFEALFDNALIRVREGNASTQARVLGGGGYDPFDGIVSPSAPAKIVIRTNHEISDRILFDEVATAAAREFYRRVLDSSNRSRYEKRMNMGELVPMDEETFVEIARRRLLGRPADQAIHNAWWTVRMGAVGIPARGHRLLIVNIHLDKDGEGETHGHFCFGIRRNGGDPDGDRLYDFRAPWELVRRPKITEAVNVDDSLQLQGFSENLYDWLYTQTEYRFCYVRMWALPVNREQIALLDAFSRDGAPFQAGPFRPFRKNCASLGALFYDRIRPINEALVTSRGPSIDFPKKVAAEIIETELNPPLLMISNVTDDRGREATASSHIYQPQPSRASSRPFQKLAAHPDFN
ncbi:MAG: hypothetical protein AAGA96_04775 [Verrucomicrobiota bacterium]